MSGEAGASPPPPGSFELGTDGPQVIVVGVDGSQASFRAGAYAWGLARRQGSRLLAVWVRPQGAPSDLFVQSAAAMAEARDQEAQEFRQMLEWATRYYGISAATLLVRHGDPLRELTRVAEEERADAIVVGASEHAGHRFVGSLGLRLVRAGRWPVTVVP